MNYPTCMNIDRSFKVFVNDVEFHAFKTAEVCYIPVQYEEKAKVKIVTNGKFSNISVSPKRLNIQVKKTADGFEFELNKNLNLYITLDGFSLPIFFYGDKVEQYDGKATYYFKGGAIYEVGEIVLRDNESVYIEAGAVVRGCIDALGAKNIKVYGQGILDGSYYKFYNSEQDYGKNRLGICFKKCENIEIKDIIMIEPTIWMVGLFGCKDVHIDNLKQIGEVISSDGIDIVGCQNVLIENCCLRNNDDCVVVKHMIGDYGHIVVEEDWLHTPANIRIRSCVFYNAAAGNAMEIGHELRNDIISDIVFSDIDIVQVAGQGAAFSIHVGDRATVKDVLFEDIYVEHYYDKLFDFRIMKSRFNRDKEYGRIQDITFKNVYITNSQFNPGYSISLIGGHDEQHKAENILFENVYINEDQLLDFKQIDIYTKFTENIEFR